MRFQQLFKRLDHHVNRSSAWDTHAALSTLLEIVNLTTRTDVKSEVMKELERQNTVFTQFMDQPSVDTRRLESIMARQKSLIDELDAQQGQIAQVAANNEFLNTVKARAAVSGSTCSMDIPVYQYWLHLPIEKRREEIAAWVAPMQAVRNAIDLSMEVIRKSSTATEELATHGFYQQQLNPARPLQLVLVSYREPTSLFPEISAGKHRFTVRFLQQVSSNARAEQTTRDIRFLLTCCSI